MGPGGATIGGIGGNDVGMLLLADVVGESSSSSSFAPDAADTEFFTIHSNSICPILLQLTSFLTFVL
jgi:hypothetical protein